MRAGGAGAARTCRAVGSVRARRAGGALRTRWASAAAEGQLLEEMLIEIGDIMVEVTVIDEHGKPVKNAQVLVGKSDGGTNPDLYAWRKGLTDDTGKFIAYNLADGKYVLVAHTHTRNGSSAISLTNDKPSKEVQVLTHDNW